MPGGRVCARRREEDHALEGELEFLAPGGLVNEDFERKIPLVEELDDAVLEPHRAKVLRRAVDMDPHRRPPHGFRIEERRLESPGRPSSFFMSRVRLS